MLSKHENFADSLSVSIRSLLNASLRRESNNEVRVAVLYYSPRLTVGIICLVESVLLPLLPCSDVGLHTMKFRVEKRR